METRIQDPEAERTGASKELLDRLKAEEIGKSSFTYIVLTLRDKHVEVHIRLDIHVNKVYDREV